MIWNRKLSIIFFAVFTALPVAAILLTYAIVLILYFGGFAHPTELAAGETTFGMIAIKYGIWTAIISFCLNSRFFFSSMMVFSLRTGIWNREFCRSMHKATPFYFWDDMSTKELL